ncbi:unspecific monooxygenase [Teladorsagia circumcincta]|uniref:Unspecific monooxygenase n=1 Tax=Teladorsagia circumcincta TaxID=45464 RepID=A0A2G9V0I4_TELCI|nr:unspecific monooxygenase [Teladorsagia circumcincta]
MHTKSLTLVINLFQTYGKVYGIQEGLQRTLVVSDVEMVRELFTKKFDYFYGRKINIIAGNVNKDSRVHIFEAQGVRWKRLRAIAGPAFSSASLKKVRPTVESSVLALMDFFEKEADKKAFDIFPFYKEFTMDVICRIAIGQKRSEMFTNKAKVASIDAANSTTEEVQPQEPTDFIDLFLDARAEEDFNNDAEFSKSGVQSISYETIANMKYLDSVMKESLRMYPLAQIANARRCMKATTLGGIPIEKGEFVVADTMSLHYDNEIWGNDADVFRPER